MDAGSLSPRNSRAAGPTKGLKMPRKRSAYTRARAKRTRPKTPAPTEGFLIHDLARLTAVPVRMLRGYLERGLFRHSEFRGTLTRYPRRQVLRLVAALQLKAQTRATWQNIKRKLDTASEPDLERWLAQQVLEPAVADALGMKLVTPSVAANAAGARSNLELIVSASSEGGEIERFGADGERVVILPGLELSLSATATPSVRTAALRMLATLAASSWKP